MKKLAAILIPVSALFATSALAENAVITTKESRKTAAAPAEYFTGDVRLSPLASADHHSGTSAGHVTFSQGARSAWHTHPKGQTLIVTEGTGWVQEEGGRKVEVKPGDVIWTPPGVKHWHGATSSSSMSHIALTENVDGKNVDWMEKVTDAEYSQ